MTKEVKPDCYKCKYKGSVSGSAHSSCNHPDAKRMIDMIMNSIEPEEVKLKVRADQYGIDSGWFNFPFNFDPVWLEECNGFKRL